jgi:sigma-B regulation protein RsbU (phosphoserine phosphatase)
MLVTELIGGAIGCTMLALGLASVMAWTLRRPRGDRVLLWFGAWCGLYGARLIAEQPAFLVPMGGSARAWEFFRAFATYAINVPIALFIEALIGAGWKQSIRRVWQVLAVAAIGGIIIDLVAGRPRAGMPLNSPLILTSFVACAANVWIARHRLAPQFKLSAIGAGGLIAILAVFNENIGRPIVPSINLEPIGVFIFVAFLGYSVVGTVFRQEAILVAVQRELETARRIQTSLLPRELPKMPGLDLAARYLPMTAVAGDLYDVIELGPSRAGVLVADVAGHGVPAALVASMVKLAFSAQADDANDPARVLTAINRILCRHVGGTYVTAIYAVFDIEARVIRIANAGHPPLLLGRADRRVIQSNHHGLILGIMPDAIYTNSQLDLHDGDCVLLYTDGIPETQNPQGDFLDLDRIRGWLASADGHDAPKFADATLDRLHGWRGGTAFDDDVTFVVARFTNEAAAEEGAA